MRKLVPVTLALAATTMLADKAYAEGLSPQDSQIVDAQIEKVISALKKSDATGAVNSFFSSSKMLPTTDARLQNLRNQITNGVQIYGPVTACSLHGSDDFTAIVSRRDYVCAHKLYATRWQFVMVKLADGWSAASMIFDDKIEAGPFSQ